MSLPDLAPLLAKLGITEHDPEGSGIAELYLEILSNNPKTRLLLEASSIPLCFNFEVISALLAEENITPEDIHIFLSSKMLEEDNGLTLPYRRLPDLIRQALRKYLAKEKYDFFLKISSRAYCFFQADVNYQAEAFYHGLIANPSRTVEYISQAYYTLEQSKQDLSIRKIGMALEDLLRFPGLSPMAEACVQLYVGKIKSTKIDLHKRTHLIQNALALFQNLALPKGEAESWHALGDVYWATGKTEVAGYAYMNACHIILDSIPGDHTVRWRHEEATIHAKLGKLFKALYMPKAAIKEFNKHKDIIETLDKAQKNIITWQLELAAVRIQTSGAFVSNGNLSSAHQGLIASQVVYENISKSTSCAISADLELAVIYSEIASVLMKLGEYEEAKKKIEIAKSILEDMRSHSHGVGYQKELLVIYSQYGDVLTYLHDFESALEFYRRDYVESSTLALWDASYRPELAISCSKLGDVLIEHGALEEAHGKYKEDCEISKALIEEEPTNAEYQFGMSVALIKMGRLYALQENYLLAQEMWAQAKNILQELLDRPFRDCQCLS